MISDDILGNPQLVMGRKATIRLGNGTTFTGPVVGMMPYARKLLVQDPLTGILLTVPHDSILEVK